MEQETSGRLGVELPDAEEFNRAAIGALTRVRNQVAQHQTWYAMRRTFSVIYGEYAKMVGDAKYKGSLFVGEVVCLAVLAAETWPVGRADSPEDFERMTFYRYRNEVIAALDSIIDGYKKREAEGAD